MSPLASSRTAALVLCAVLALPAWPRDRDHDRALGAVQAGQVLPLPAVLERLGREHPGKVLEVELEEEHGVYVYEVKLLRADGRLLKLELDARTGALLRLRPKDGRRGGEGRR